MKNKFRVWDKVLNKFISWNCLFITNFDSSEYIFHQFIGLYAQGNREIYEGDIVRNQAGRIFVVGWVYRGFEYLEYVDKKKGIFNGWVGDEKLCQVVGNVLENNNLINDERS
jgi:hypothetical protein